MRIAFVDDLCHKKTGSTEFLVDVLNKTNIVKRFWGNGFKKFDKKELGQINNWKPDLILFFQRIPNFLILNKFNCKNLVFVPMHDQEIHYGFMERKLLDLSLFITKTFFKLRVLCFCNADSVYYNNFDLLLVKYYPKPVKSRPILKDKVLFFWERIDSLPFSKLMEMFDLKQFEKVYFMQRNDAGCECLHHSFYKLPKNVIVVDNWLSKRNYEKIMNECNIAVAPRLCEGIGHGFLDYMARGVCIIAYDLPTHNEYIINGFNGILFKNFSYIDLKDWRRFGRNAFDTISMGNERWLIDIDNILEWVKN